MTRNVRLSGAILLMIVGLGLLMLVLIPSTQSPETNSPNIPLTATWLVQLMNGGTPADSTTPRPIKVFSTSHNETDNQPFKPSIPPRFRISDGSGLCSNFSECMCISIEPIDFWEPGDSAANLENLLTQGSQLVVDNEVIFSQENFASSVVDTLGYVSGDDRTPLGTYGGTIEICIDTNALKSGSHSAAFVVLGKSDPQYMISWDFSLG